MRGLIVALVLACSARSASAQLQQGLRLDALTSMQWSGPDVYLESTTRAVLKTHSGNIADVWPGPVQGTFAVHTSRGIGILFGKDIVTFGQIIGEGAVVRASRYDALWFAHEDAGQSVITQVRPDGSSRDLLRLKERPVDFDVDLRGNIAYLTSAGIVLAADADQRALIVLPAEVQKPSRVFIDADATEITVYAPTRLGRFDLHTRKWTVVDFVEATDALVRQAYTRRMMIEPKFP